MTTPGRTGRRRGCRIPPGAARHKARRNAAPRAETKAITDSNQQHPARPRRGLRQPMTPPRRIVYVSWPADEIAGGIKMAFRHVEALRGAGFTACIATPDAKPPPWFQT